MITGAASADVGLLVVAATPGEFEAGFPITTTDYTASSETKGHSYKAVNMTAGGQTREHVILARGLGVSQLIVAVNKLDAAEPPWSQARFDEIRSRLLPFLKTSGFAPKRIRFVPISGLNGINIKENTMNKADDSLFKWYKGPTLIDAIDNFVPAKRNIGTYCNNNSLSFHVFSYILQHHAIIYHNSL
jgi:translation elongation factor EF-1alpha